MKIVAVASDLGRESAVELAGKVCNQLLDTYTLQIDNIAVRKIIGYSTCSEYTCPSFSCLVAERLGMQVVAYDVGSHRLSFFNWLSMPADEPYIGIEVIGSIEGWKRASAVLMVPEKFEIGGYIVRAATLWGRNINIGEIGDHFVEFGVSIDVSSSVIYGAERTYLEYELESPIEAFGKMSDNKDCMVWHESYGSGVVAIKRC